MLKHILRLKGNSYQVETQIHRGEKRMGRTRIEKYVDI